MCLFESIYGKKKGQKMMLYDNNDNKKEWISVELEHHVINLCTYTNWASIPLHTHKKSEKLALMNK